jgi:hypothetical protein
MATKTFQAEHLQCEMFLFNGMERIKDSFTLTAKVDVSPSPRWMQWMGGSHAQEMLISSLPRVCRCVVVSLCLLCRVFVLVLMMCDVM